MVDYFYKRLKVAYLYMFKKVKSAAGAVVSSGKTINRTFSAMCAGGALALVAVVPAHAQVTSTTITAVEGTFDQIQGLGESASLVAATLAVISVAVSFIWRARG